MAIFIDGPSKYNIDNDGIFVSYDEIVEVKSTLTESGLILTFDNKTLSLSREEVYKVFMLNYDPRN